MQAQIGFFVKIHITDNLFILFSNGNIQYIDISVVIIINQLLITDYDSFTEDIYLTK